MTTFRKLPTQSPTIAATATATYGYATITLDDGAELEDRQIHRDDQAADDDTQEHDHHRLEQARQRCHGVIDFALVEIGDLAEHIVERARLFADLRHLQHHVREDPLIGHRVG